MLIRWDAAAGSDCGRKRRENQDCFLCEDDLELYAVSDGMGGVMFGKETSEMVTRMLAEYCKMRLPVNEVELKETIVKISSEIREKGNFLNQEALYGATLTGFLKKQTAAMVFNVGDSRVYCLRKGKKIVQLTEDDSLLQLFLDAGIELDERKTNGIRCRITQFMGRYETVKPYVFTYELQDGDVLCACSDGLSNMITSEELEEVLKTEESPSEQVKRLIDLANDAGGNDNITVIVCKIEMEEQGEKTDENIEYHSTETG